MSFSLRRDARDRSALFYAVDASNIRAVTLLLPRMRELCPDSEGKSVLVAAITAGETKREEEGDRRERESE